MASLQYAIGELLKLLMQFAAAVGTLLTAFEFWLRDELNQLGVPPAFQTVVLIVVAAVLILGSLRAFGGLIRVAVVLVLLLIAIHIVVPVFQG